MSRSVASWAFMRMMSVCTRPTREVCSTGSSGGTVSIPSWNTTCNFTMFSCSWASDRSSSTRPWSMMPTWSHTSSSSRRLWDETSTVVPRSATSPMTSDHTCRRMTGSSPSTGSSKMRYSGMQQRASQKATCFCMPLLRRRITRFSSMENTSLSFSYRSILK